MEPLQVNIRLDPDALKALGADLDNLSGRARVIARQAINQTGRVAFSRVARAIYARLNLPLSEIRRRNVFFHQATTDRLEAQVNVRGRPIPIGRFAPRPSAPAPTTQRRLIGSSVEIVRGQRQVMPGSFTARMASGHVGVFLRQRGAGRKPIFERRAGTVPQLISGFSELARDTLEQTFGELLEKNIAHLVDLELQRRAARG